VWANEEGVAFNSGFGRQCAAAGAGRPRELWKGHYSHGMSTSCDPPGATSSNYDVTGDGKRFLMIKDDDLDRTVSKQLIVVLGWVDELRRRTVKS